MKKVGEKGIKKAISLLLASLLCLQMFFTGTIDAGAQAANDGVVKSEIPTEAESANALMTEEVVETPGEESPWNDDPYAGSYSVNEEAEVSSADVLQDDSATQTFGTAEEAGVYIREQIKERKESGSFILLDTSDDSMDAVWDEVYRHTGDPEEGDYLGNHVNVSLSFEQTNNGPYNVTFSCEYRISSDQEQELDTAVEKLLSELNLDGKTEYQKVKAIYDYMCENITYDYEHLYDSDYDLKGTAYAALINKTAVCEGYANLFYRLALEAGLDARIIVGTALASMAGGHAWNIVRINGKYYNLDATWDAGSNGDYEYFLLNQKHFSDHTRSAKYDTETFHASYPMAEEDYSGALKKGKIIYTGTVNYTRAYQLLDKINEARTGNGLSGMTMDKEFLEGAVTRAEEIALLYSTKERPNGYKNGVKKKNGENSYWCWRGEDGEIPDVSNFMDEGKQSIGIGCFQTKQGVSWYFIMSEAEAESVSKPADTSVTVNQELEGDFYFDYEIDDVYDDDGYIIEGATKKVKISLEYADIEPESFQWTSSNPSVVSVSNGTITGNAVGKAVITAQTGDYVIEMPVTVKSVGKAKFRAKAKKKKIVLEISKVYSAKKYEIQYSLNKKFKHKKKKIVTTRNVVLKKLKSGRKYYIRIRAIGNSGKKGSWSKVKKVKVK